MSGDIPSQIKQSISAADMKQFFAAEAVETVQETVAQQAVTTENLQSRGRLVFEHGRNVPQFS